MPRQQELARLNSGKFQHSWRPRSQTALLLQLQGPGAAEATLGTLSFCYWPLRAQPLPCTSRPGTPSLPPPLGPLLPKSSSYLALENHFSK